MITLPTTPGSALRLVNAAAAIVVALAIVLQIATGVDGYPTVPPGAVLAVIVAAVVAFVPWRYVAVVGLIYPIWIAIGALATSGTADRLGDPGTVGPFVGTALQVMALVVGLVSGVAMVLKLRSGSHTNVKVSA